MAGEQAPAAPTLDYDVFKASIQPMFIAKRPGHARCIACHGSGTPLRLEPPAKGSNTWSEEDSRKNFETIKRVATPGNAKSRILVHALEEKAGGDFYHNGGKHWSSQSDPEWQTLRNWVMGK
jgi:mono/diheme cytochrome c family protein